ncbi:hypothetical protein [Sphingopyxis macrogoltabida]|uniref:Uncharacterized protein n=1 Tax=Sphingopyxis macrogoltabida TaxID=33050 RepID=A0AAC8YXR7_SPHMC|nr:hypothetical protein [Sphingopyxis macrogoltabida]ALJ11877.1 hypothetical protein LH19_03250 [Sphingopyxis macrogoltabida]AMU88061.1 hypothetical protein ATM17_03220 [Sphingopyxis macrogoltabida]
MSLLLALAMTPPPPEPIFACSFGAKQLVIAEAGGALIYRYGTATKTELRLVANAASNRVFYHRTLYPRAEDQTLRFVNGEYNYVVYAHWSAPSAGMTEEASTPESHYGGLIVMRGERELASYRCSRGGDMREWPIFKTLPTDETNMTPPE